MTNPYIDEDHAAKQDGRRQRLEERSAKAAARSDALHDEASEMASHIPFGQPILVGHHSEGRDRRYRDRIGNKFDKSAAEHKKAGELAARADSVGTGGISSTDPEALDKLRQQLDDCRTKQDHMKAVNKALRAKNYQPLRDMGLSQEIIDKLKVPDVMGCVGYPSYALQNNNANMRRIEKRIADIEAMRDSAPIEAVCLGFEVKTEDGYFRIEFEGKPKAEARQKCKNYGFRWSRYNGAWQRKATPGGRAAVRQLVEALEKFGGELY